MSSRIVLPWILSLTGIIPLLSGCGAISSVAKNQEGLRYYSQADYEKSIQVFRKAVTLDNTNADAHYNLASAYHKVGLLNGNQEYLKWAEAEYNRCLDFSDENHPQCYKGLSTLLDQTGRFDKAIVLLTGWSDRYPSSIEPKIQLAYMYDKSNRPSVALDYLVKAYEMDRNNPRILAALGFLRERQGNTAQALIDYEQSLAAKPDQPAVSARLAALRARNFSSSGSGTVIR